MPQSTASAVDALSSTGILTLVSLASSMVSIALGAVAIWLSLYLYHKSNELMVHVIRALSEIAASTKTTETTTSQVTTRVIDVLAEQARSAVTRAEQDAKLMSVLTIYGPCREDLLTTFPPL